MGKKIILGMFTGIISGLFAVGGGMILIPSFVYIFKLDEKVARGTAIISILPMAITSSIFYYNSSYIDWNIGVKCMLGGMVGGIFGAKMLKKMSPFLLEIIFIFLLIYAAIKMIKG